MALGLELGFGREGERREREARGYEPFALHAPRQWARRHTFTDWREVQTRFRM
jgi:hypothetical protein